MVAIELFLGGSSFIVIAGWTNPVLQLAWTKTPFISYMYMSATA